ncbi:MAG: hypothetical protein QOE71_1879 [Pseudonocardiales bacterium]|nr:hypothetical protein [Pseudonocardiales bacterium]
MTSAVSSAILLLFGAALVKLGISDELLHYVRPASRPWVFAAGLALLVLAGWSLLSQFRPPSSPDSDDPRRSVTDQADAEAHLSQAGSASGGHNHHGATRTAWLVLAPVLALLIVAPPALGEFTANRAPAVNATASGQKASLAAGSTPVELNMLMFYLLSSAKPAALAGRPVTLVGFVEKQQPGGFTLARLVITCCAADASTVKVTITAHVPPPAVGSWVQVTGQFAGVGSDADHTPALAATATTGIPAPKNPYG